MKRLWIFGLAVMVAMALFWAAGGGQAQASNKIAKQEKLQCTVCHDKPGSKLLTDKGKYYEEMRTLDGYDEVVAAFSQCTSCHVKKPGSKEMTERGAAYSFVVHDMEGLRKWLQENHPQLKRSTEPEKPSQ